MRFAFQLSCCGRVLTEGPVVLRRLRTCAQRLLGESDYLSTISLNGQTDTRFQYATDFYQAIVNITSGLMLPLTTADLLTHAIVGSVLENLDMERLVREVGQAVSQRILGNNESVDDVARELHERLLLRNESTKKVVIESIYRDSEEAKHNVSVYMEAPSLADARPHLKRVCSPDILVGGRLTGCNRYLVHVSRTNTFMPAWHLHGAPITGRRISPQGPPSGRLQRNPPHRRHRPHAKSSQTSRHSGPHLLPASSARPCSLHRFPLQEARRLSAVSATMVVRRLSMMMTTMTMTTGSRESS